MHQHKYDKEVKGIERKIKKIIKTCREGEKEILLRKEVYGNPERSPTHEARPTARGQTDKQTDDWSR